MFKWYARLLSHYPYVIVLIVLTVVAGCMVLTFTVGHDINFDNPLLGFEPRGTELADRLLTFENLLNNGGGQANLLPDSHDQETKSPLNLKTNTRSTSSDSTDYNVRSKIKPPRSLQSTVPNHRIKPNEENETKRNIFCDVPDKSYSRIIVTSAHGRSLFNYEDLIAMCQLEDSYFGDTVSYQDACIKKETDGSCCSAWSIGSYVSVLRNKSSCANITADDVDAVHQLLATCAPFFRNHTLKHNCDSENEEWYYNIKYPPSVCHNVPEPCQKYNAIYHIFHYLSDSNFVFTGQSSKQPGNSKMFLKYSALFLPLPCGPDAMDVFQSVDKMPRVFRDLSLVGAKFGVKFSLFEKYLISDSAWLGAACAVIFVAMWIYTTSVFITVMAFLSMFWAVEVAYVLYTFVFKIKFFPYMNMVTLIVMVGIGADDLFIYCKVWRLAKSEKNNGVLEKIVGDTLRHTTLSMLVTSLTTAAAFYANYISDITAIRCFSVFAGTCIVINFILTVTWLPASIILHEKWLHCCVGLSDKKSGIFYCFCKVPYKVYYLICDWSRIFFEKLLPCLVIKFRYVWLTTFGVLWIGSIVVIFFYPRLRLPNSRKFQVFASDHLLERYDFELGDMFQFELLNDQDDRIEFPITIVWGVLTKDSGDPLDPNNKGVLTLDPEFDLTSPDAQRWILEFCSRLRRTEFYLHSPGLSLTDCFFENFVRRYMKQPCDQYNTVCCNQTTFPFHKSNMLSCLSKYIPYLNKTPSVSYNHQSPGPRFNNGEISAFFVQFRSNLTYSLSYEEVHSFYLRVNQWVTEELLGAPPEMRRGWFVSDFHFYDLQNSLAMGTPLALGVSLSVVAVVSFFTTLNVLVSIYALLAVGAAISVTLAALVLMNWELDVLESVVITIAIGLAVDLTLHYGVAFKLTTEYGREMRVITSLGRMGSPVAMATFTTMMAGALIMPSTVLAYKKFGTFLLLLASVAWLYATFFFQALLRVMGPHGGCGQFHWPASDCCTPPSREHVDKTIYALSESTLSSSSTSTREHSNSHSYSCSHEMEPLTDRHRHHHRHHRNHGHSSQSYSSDSDPHRHQQRLNPIPCHHQHHRPRRRGDYTAVRTNVKILGSSTGVRQKQDLLIPSTSSESTPASPSDNNTLSVPSDSPASGQSNNELSSDMSDYDNKAAGSDSDNVIIETTQVQMEKLPCSVLLQVA